MSKKSRFFSNLYPFLSILFLIFSAQRAQATECSSEFVSSLLTTSEVIEYLKTHDAQECLRDFAWDFDDNLLHFMREKNVIAALEEVERLAPHMDGIDSDNIYELLYFVRIAYYHNFWEDDVFPEFTEAVREANRDAGFALSANPELVKPFTEAAFVYETWLYILDEEGVREHFYSFVKLAFTRITEEVLANRDEYFVTSAALFVVYRSTNDEGFLMELEKDPEIISVMSDLLAESWIREDYEILTINLIRSLNWLSSEESLIPRIQEVLQALASDFERLSVYYVELAYVIDRIDGANCVNYLDSTGFPICELEIKYELHDKLFPFQYTFFDGEISVDTSLNEGVVRLFYQAIKDIRTQFFNLTQQDIPVEGDTNDVLKIKLYGSVQEYDDFQEFLFDTGTDNGGIYVDSPEDFEGNPDYGTFYTYQRTPNDSIFTLEELFRHEYVHTLVARYLVKGNFGDAPIRRTNRYTWFSEGIAEFLSWSTRGEGIKIKRTNIEDIANDVEWMTIREIVESNYDNGFGFYDYSALFIHYLHNEQPELLQKIISLVRTTDTEGYLELMEEMANNSALQEEYYDFLRLQIAQQEDLDIPFTVDIHPDSLVANKAVQIQNQLNIFTNWGLSCKQKYSDSIAEVECKGRMVSRSVEKRIRRGLAILKRFSRLNNFEFFNCYHIRTRDETICNSPLRSSDVAYDSDADGVPNRADDFPNDNRGAKDLNSNGILDEFEIIDSDSDKIPDGYEIANYFNQSDPNDAQLDADADLLSNLLEYKNGSNPLDTNSPNNIVDINFYLRNDSYTPKVDVSNSVDLYIGIRASEKLHNVRIEYSSNKLLTISDNLYECISHTKLSDTSGILYCGDVLDRVIDTYFEFTPHEAGQYQLMINVVSDDFEVYPEDNMKTFNIEVLP